MRNLIVTFFGSGYLPIAPGTWGSAAALICYLEIYALWPATIGWNGILLILIAVACAGSVACGPWAVRHFRTKDPGPFVLDEVAGQWLALVALPVSDFRSAVAAALVQFVVFRALDILKPPPARRLERLPFGWGILLDDLASGAYANVIGQAFFRLFWAGLAARLFA